MNVCISQVFNYGRVLSDSYEMISTATACEDDRAKKWSWFYSRTENGHDLRCSGLRGASEQWWEGECRLKERAEGFIAASSLRGCENHAYMIPLKAFRFIHYLGEMSGSLVGVFDLLMPAVHI